MQSLFVGKPAERLFCSCSCSMDKLRIDRPIVWNLVCATLHEDKFCISMVTFGSIGSLAYGVRMTTRELMIHRRIIEI